MTGLLFALFFLFMLIGVPIALSIGASTMAALYFQGVPLMVVTQQMFQGINSFALVAVPMFILAGDLMAQGKVSEKLVSFADSLFGFLKGGLSIVAVRQACSSQRYPAQGLPPLQPLAPASCRSCVKKGMTRRQRPV